MYGVLHRREVCERLAKQCLDITFDRIAVVVREVLKPLHVPFVFAPYEADHQMVWLARNELVHSILTADSDLIAHGCASVFNLRTLNITNGN